MIQLFSALNVDPNGNTNIISGDKDHVYSYLSGEYGLELFPDNSCISHNFSKEIFGVSTTKSAYVSIFEMATQDIESIKSTIIYHSPDAIYLSWRIDDILRRAKEHDYFITEDIAREVLTDAESNHDANYGVGWETLDVYIDELLPGLVDEWKKQAISVPDNIQSIEDIAHFFAQLTLFHKIAHHPDTPFSDYISRENGQPTFTEDGAANMEAIMDKCHEIFDAQNPTRYSSYEDLSELANHVDWTIQRFNI